MKFITLVIFAILAFCVALSDARLPRPMHKMRLRGSDKKELTLKKYEDEDCKGKPTIESLEEKDCSVFSTSQVEKIGVVRDGRIAVRYCNGNCGTDKANCESEVFTKDKCRKNGHTGEYVIWTWDED